MKLNFNSQFKSRNPSFRRSNPIDNILGSRINYILYKRERDSLGNFLPSLIPELFLSYDRKGGEGFFFYINKEEGEWRLSHYSDQFELGEWIGEEMSQGKEGLFKIIPYENSVYKGEEIKDKIMILQ